MRTAQQNRLAAGGVIDRSQPVPFRFDGESFTGHAGDTLAFAILANGVRLVGRSFKYHRQRGIFTAGPEEPNTLVELRTGACREPNSKATTVELYDGLEAVSQNRWPSLSFDVMMASALRTYVNRFAAVPGRRVAVFTTTDDGWSTAFDLAAAGESVEAVIDPRTDVPDSFVHRAAKTGARLLLGGVVLDAHGSARGVTHVDVRKGDSTIRLEVDTLAVSGGWNPQVALTTHKGAKPRWSDELSTFVPGDLPDGMSAAGAANGDFSLATCLRTGAEAGGSAARDLGFNAMAGPPLVADDEPVGVRALWHVAGSRRKAFVDLQNDVTAKDVELAYQEGFRSVEHLKRYTTLGMATDQGKTSNINGHAMMAGLTGRTITQTGTTVSRAPHLPVTIGALAGPHRGKHFKATRYIAGHDWALSHGATMIEAGQWLRPQWFTKAGEADWLESVTREVRTVRSAVGVCDVSTLGKIDIQGRDAGVLSCGRANRSALRPTEPRRPVCSALRKATWQVPSSMARRRPVTLVSGA